LFSKKTNEIKSTGKNYLCTKLDENCLFDKKNTKTIKSFLIDETKFFQQENVISFIFPFSLMNQNATKILQLKGKFAAKMQNTIFRASKESSKTIIT
jgi:hypothetical protein